MNNLIIKKRNGVELSDDEIKYMIDGYTNGTIPDYQMSAMLMAIYFNGMSDCELSALTNAVVYSGDIIDLSSISGVKVDKHSTGGVGDKTTLIVAPIVAACGIKVAKMSGRGLGHTGGTIDKLESITGFRTELSNKEFFDIVDKIGVCIAGQTGNLTPADKKLYALRDVTGTVESIPLIAASIMGKKLAAGSDCILIDVKCGSGAFMKTLDKAALLAKKIVAIGELAGKRTVCLVTNMDMPLGNAIGNSLEVIEAVEILNGRGNSALSEICVTLASNMLLLAGKGTAAECTEMALEAVASGNALNKFMELVKAQGGDAELIADPTKFAKSQFSFDLIADKSGYIHHIDTEKCGIASVSLGAGRKVKDDKIDYHAGIVFSKAIGDNITIGEKIATLYANDNQLFPIAASIFLNAISIEAYPPVKQSLILARIDKDGIEIY